MRRLLLVLAGTLLASCSVNDQGLQQLNSGNNAAAFQSFTKCAQQGDPWCYNNLGVMYERGVAPGGVNIAQAAYYYRLAARYGIPVAQENLRQLGYSVPPNDLQAAYQAQQAQKAAAMRKLGDQLVQQANGNYQPATPQPNTYNVTPAYPDVGAQIVPARCSSDNQCGTGRLCVRPAGDYTQGICVQPVDDMGMRTYDIPAPSAGPHDYPSCRAVTDCPIGFECFRAQGWFNGLCRKR